MVLATGAFDGLHAGHVRYLARAEALCGPGEPFYVAVAPDQYIEQVKQRTAHWSQRERAETLRYCIKGAVLEQLELTPAALIRRLRPRLLVKGQDWNGRLPDDVRAACAAVRCAVIYVDAPGRHVQDAMMAS